jgi:hypothetical protein
MDDWINTASDIMVVVLFALFTDGDVVMAVTPNGVVMGVV